MIDIEKFICSLLADHPEGVAVRGDIHRALKEQGLEYKGGKIVPIEDNTELKESDERIRKGIIRNLEYLLDRAEGFVKDELKERIAWLEKQSWQKQEWSEEDENGLGDALWAIKQAKTIAKDENDMGNLWYAERWLNSIKDRVWSNQGEQKSAERKDFISIPFGAYDSELVNETITIPDGCVATIEGNKIFIKREDKSATEAIKEEKVNDDSANNDASSFKAGDWVVRTNGENFCNGSKSAQIQSIELDGEMCYLDTGRWLYPSEIRAWSIKDVKDGDVICYKDEISLYKHDIKNCTKQGITFGGFVYYCCYDGKRFITDSLYSLTEQDKMDIHPATKEQRNLLFQKMREAGYTWDSKKEPIRRI